MLATVLARPVGRPVERVAQWRQLIDLLAQHRSGVDPALARRALARLRELRAEIPVAARRETAHAFSGRRLPAPLVVFLAGDVAPVAGVLLGGVRQPEEDWLAILPRLSPTARALLRHRRDLGVRVEAALASFGAADLVLAGDAAGDVAAAEPPLAVSLPVAASASGAEVGDAGTAALAPVLEPGAGEGQIRAIISRIERFREGRDGAPAPRDDAPADSFRFETGPDGVVIWVEGAPRGPLIGRHVAEADGAAAVAEALARRAPFRDAPFRVPGRSAAAGSWRIAGVPVFAAGSGRFEGYRGSARRSGADGAAGCADLGLRPDSLRQLVHELRTPLNAIGGFAEMIRRQMRGPVATAYRERADLIVEQAGRLLAAVDDLDVAARLETHRLDLQWIEVDLAAKLMAICERHREEARRRGVGLDWHIASGVPAAAGDPAALSRMIGRLVAASLALAGEGETVRVTLGEEEGGRLALSVSRPARLAGQAAEALFDPGFGPAGESPDAPLLGLGFSLHLVRRLAAAAKGALSVEAERFVLRLPACAAMPRADAG